MRGKHPPTEWTSSDRGSIPACAGETQSQRRLLIFERVYPRLCGGNHISFSKKSVSLGLSPLVRGKLMIRSPPNQAVGSIPACAGETGWVAHNWSLSGVYPRLCGGNRVRPAMLTLPWGLSPLVRGKLLFIRIRRSARGSIPACAGETLPFSLSACAWWVYPRLCGGNP